MCILFQTDSKEENPKHTAGFTEGFTLGFLYVVMLWLKYDL